MGSLTLTPGNLLKLLHSMNSDAKVAGDHRSVLLQVLSIAPAPSTNHRFFIHLSDSAHSTYVSLSDSDNNLVLANRIQLGQFAYVDRLQFDSPPVPCAFGLRPIPGRHPFVGNPKPLIAQISPSKRGFVIQPVSDDEIGEPGVVISAKENTPMVNSGGGRMEKRQFLSGCGRSVSVGKRGSGPPPLAERENSPARKSSSRPSSPIPLKCEVPSMVATNEERRRPLREMAIMVPSRYRQQSPSGQKQESPRGRSSLSPGRTLHGGLKVLPGVSDTEMKKKMVVGISKVSDALVGSTKNMGKSLEGSGGADAEQKDKGVLGNINDSQVNSSRARAAFRTQSNDSHGCQSNLEDFSVNEKASSSCKIENLPPNLRKLGKDALRRRSLASAAAAAALEEASATEAVIRNLSMFSHLCSLSSKARNPLPIINQFLTLYEDTVKSTVIAEMLTACHSSSDNHREAATTAYSQGWLKSIYLWIEAALASDLEAISLRVNQTENLPDFQKLEKPISLSPTRTNTSSTTRHSLTTLTKKHPKVTSPSTLSSESLTWVRGHGVEETAELAKNLQREMQVWFLGFMEEALDAGLQVSGKSSANENGQLAAILSHLKLVNEWLDRAGRNREEGSMEKMERLKQKIYGFVMQRVGTAIGGLNSNETS